MYEFLYDQPLESLDVDAAVAQWPTWEELAAEITGLYDIDEIREKALLEAKTKYITAEALAAELEKLKQCWPDLKARLQEHLPSVEELTEKLTLVGAPSDSESIGVSPETLQLAYRKALHIRRRYTVLDLADRTGVFAAALTDLFPTPTAKA
jgi:glycerol-1-phosphate dehydrogenase [NAD(P)+]